MGVGWRLEADPRLLNRPIYGVYGQKVGEVGSIDQLLFLLSLTLSSSVRPWSRSHFTYLLCNPHLPHLVSAIRLT